MGKGLVAGVAAFGCTLIIIGVCLMMVTETEYREGWYITYHQDENGRIIPIHHPTSQSYTTHPHEGFGIFIIITGVFVNIGAIGIGIAESNKKRAGKNK